MLVLNYECLIPTMILWSPKHLRHGNNKETYFFRLFQYNSAKNQSKVLLDNLWFPNGVAISPDNQFVVVVETLRLRLLKYYIDGPNKGKSEVLVAGLPGNTSATSKKQALAP